MKSELTNWRFWLIVIQVAICAVLLFAEPTEGMTFKKTMFLLLTTKAGAVLLGIGILAECKLWKNHFKFTSALFDEED